MPKANELKKNEVVELDGQLLHVRDIAVNNPSARGAATLYKIRFTNIRTRLKHEQRFKGDEVLNAVELNKCAVSYCYTDGDEYVFMDDEDYTQYTFNRNDLEDDLLFLSEGIQGLHVLIADDQPIGLELPASVELEITETAPAMKAASASARSKPAHFATGLVVQVPEYLQAGERVRIHVAERRFMSRAD